MTLFILTILALVLFVCFVIDPYFKKRHKMDVQENDAFNQRLHEKINAERIRKFYSTKEDVEKAINDAINPREYTFDSTGRGMYRRMYGEKSPGFLFDSFE